MAFTSLTPGAMLCPVPAVMVSCASEKDRPNIITIAWAGTVCSQPPMVSVAVRKERFSHHIMTDSGEFVVNLVGEGQLRAMDYCGVRSGREEDKFAACQLTPAKVPGLRYAPAIAECPLYLACRTEQVLELGSHDLFIGRVVGMGVQEELLDHSGKIDLQRAKLVAYSHGVYQSLGPALGFFGYSVAAPEVLERRMKELNK
ncbi:MAG: flavin reductase family protein [Clostridia bacterium]|nr:flavin reductase family protein [Clostridia bacterium]